jgi:hypothetical protein
MADIFLSYASGNRRKVSVLASLFDEAGWSTWWDRKIGVGEDWPESIQKEVAQARCVVVA